MSDPVIYTLKFPVTALGQEWTRIELSRPKGKHLKAISVPPTMTDILSIASKTSGVHPTVFDEMDATDCIAVGEIVAGFLASGQGTGES
jgi:hypothetical protein